MGCIEYLKSISLEKKYKLLAKAYKEICKTLREHPVDMDWYTEDETRFAILYGGNERDPEGIEWGIYFLERAIMEEIENGKND